jgi:hypothetical protein
VQLGRWSSVEFHVDSVFLHFIAKGLAFHCKERLAVSSTPRIDPKARRAYYRRVSHFIANGDELFIAHLTLIRK